MRRILLRAHKDPFEAVSPEQAWAENLIGNNSGNLIFSLAAHKILLTRDTEVTSYRPGADQRDADRINAEYDVFVVPLANAFRSSFKANLLTLTKLIERLRIPVVVLGVGAQSTLGYDMARLQPINGIVRRFARAVLDRSASIGVRGEFTQDYLQDLGFKNTHVIGCPSMFFNGSRLHIGGKSSTLNEDSSIGVNISPYVKRIGGIIMSHYHKYRNLVYIAQDLATLELLLWGDHPEDAQKWDKVPVHTTHPLYKEDKIRLFVDPWPWLTYLADLEFSFGTRIHGNIASLIAGTPSYVLAHDSRTLELARYFGIPHMKLPKPVPATLDAAQLLEEADYSDVEKGHPARFASFADFLHVHGLDHAFSDRGDGGTAFDQQLRGVEFPSPVGTLSGADPDDIAHRISWLRERNIELARRVEELEAMTRPRQGYIGGHLRFRPLIRRLRDGS